MPKRLGTYIYNDCYPFLNSHLHVCGKVFLLLRARVAQWVRYLDYLATHPSLSPIRHEFAPIFVNYKKGALDSAASDNGYQLLAHGRWFTPDTPASSTTKAGHHDITEILLKVVLSFKNQSINHYSCCLRLVCSFLGFLLALTLGTRVYQFRYISFYCYDIHESSTKHMYNQFIKYEG